MPLKTLGKYPTKDRRKRVESSPNYRDGVFQNINPTSMNKEGGSTFQTFFDFLTYKKPSDIRPSKPIPGLMIDLKAVEDKVPKLIWFGHSSYLIKYQGLNFLIDPVFSGHASPFQNVVPAFAGTDKYTAEDFPEIDFLILTHDHYDHIDYETVVKFLPKTKSVICPLGCGEHLEHWGYDSSKITELDWWESHRLRETVKITATPARHFSGRSFSRNKTLWASYVLEIADKKIFIGGDSGYDDQFAKIGKTFGVIDFALIECGQYGVNWPFIHMFPEQTAMAAKDLNAKVLMPVHWGKFVLSVHSWTEPIERLLIKARELRLAIATPMIGEVVHIGEPREYPSWWREV